MPSTSPGVASSPPTAVAVSLRGLSRIYPGRVPVVALHDIDLDFREGDTVAVMGASGSGKTTLLNICGGLDPPTSGSVVVHGVDLSQLTADQRAIFRRDHLSYVFQAYHLMPTLTAAQNVALPLQLQGVTARTIATLVADTLAAVKLTMRADHLPDELSGGERQRVAIARALITNARLLLADEPTGNLDSTTGDAILDTLIALQRSRGATLVIVTHDQRIAARCDRIVHLRDGQLSTDTVA